MPQNAKLKRLERIEQNLRDQKRRRSFDDFHGDQLDAEDRLRTIKDALEDNPDLSELHRHAIVGSIAALQTYHRGYLVNVMSYDPLARIRGADQLSDKFTLRETIEFFGSDRLSAEELIAQAAPANSVSDLVAWLNAIFGEDFKTLLAAAVMPMKRAHSHNAPRILADVDGLISALSLAFDARHILAHEAAPDFEVGFEAAIRSIDAVQSWIDATQGVVWQTVLMDEPLTQYEMNAVAGEALAKSSKSLADAIKSLRRNLAFEQKIEFFRNHRAWKQNTHELGSLSFGSLDGSMWPAVHARSLASIYEARTQAIQEWCSYLELG